MPNLGSILKKCYNENIFGNVCENNFQKALLVQTLNKGTQCGMILQLSLLSLYDSEE